jgi:uncharacterized repeat protein (TIGR03803 family)
MWSERILLNFMNDGSDGYNPHAQLIFDTAGNLYGTTEGSNVFGGGTAFQLTLGANGKWTENVLNSFGDNDGAYPLDGLIVDGAGNLYGTTWQGGTNYGTVFQLSPTGAGGLWTENVLHNFDSNGKDGYYPEDSLILDAAGNLYGTASAGGSHNYGIVFRLKPAANGTWREDVLHNFGFSNGGVGPAGSVILGAAGNLYGTTVAGGTGQCQDDYGDIIGCGTVFEITP